MLARLAFVILLCALFVPRLAMDAHLGGHGALISGEAVHTHHADHLHEAGQGKSEGRASLVGKLGDADGAERGFTHDHGSAFGHAFALIAPDHAVADAWVSENATHFPDRIAAHYSSRLDSLLRPPRAA